MKRRQFLSSVTARCAGAAVAGGAVAATARDGAADGARRAVELLGGRVDALRERVDEMDARYRKSLRVLLALTTVTTGIDVATLL